MKQKRVETARGGRSSTLGKNDPRDRRNDSVQAQRATLTRQDFADIEDPPRDMTMEDTRDFLMTLLQRLRGAV